MQFRTLSALALFVTTLLIGTPVAASAATQQIKVMSYNTHHGGNGSSVTLQSQLDTIAAQNPDVVLLQEVSPSHVDAYVKGLNARQQTTAWHGSVTKHCDVGIQPTCKTYTSEGVAVLTKLTTVAVTPRLIWAQDSYHAARATLRMTVALADGTQVTVFAAHLPALVAYASARVTWVNTFKTWAAGFGGPKIAGGDFNERPAEKATQSMLEHYKDAWTAGGTGYGYTHMKEGTTTLYRRIDYLFFDNKSGLTQTSVKVAGDVNDSDHVAVVATYTVPSTSSAVITPAVTPPVTITPTAPTAPIAPTATTLFADRFDAFDATQWPTRVITGTQDLTIPVTIAGGALQIGALKESVTGAHYNGISTPAFNLSSNGCASVQLTGALNLATPGYAMFAVVRNSNNLYRWYQSGDALIGESKLAGVKKVLVDLPYSATAHQFLRIRKATNVATGTQDVVFETAPNNNGAPGVYTERYRDTWAAAVTASALKVEIKAGTSGAVIDAGTATWDNVLMASQCQ